MRYNLGRERINARPIGSRLREVRKYFGFSQGKMAGILGITRDTLSKNERGYNSVQVDTLHALHESLGVSVEWLLFNRGAMFWDAGMTKDSNQGGKAEGITFSTELDEMIDLMKRVPFLRHAVMGYFQKFKIENNHLIDSTLEKAEETGNTG